MTAGIGAAAGAISKGYLITTSKVVYRVGRALASDYAVARLNRSGYRKTASLFREHL